MRFIISFSSTFPVTDKRPCFDRFHVTSRFRYASHDWSLEYCEKTWIVKTCIVECNYHVRQYRQECFKDISTYSIFTGEDFLSFSFITIFWISTRENGTSSFASRCVNLVLIGSSGTKFSRRYSAVDWAFSVYVLRIV